MKADRLGLTDEKEVIEFLEYMDQNLPNNNELFYFPCVVCGNIKNK